MLSEVLGWIAFAAVVFVLGQVVFCWRSVRRSQVILITTAVMLWTLYSLLRGVR